MKEKYHIPYRNRVTLLYAGPMILTLLLLALISHSPHSGNEVSFVSTSLLGVVSAFTLFMAAATLVGYLFTRNLLLRVERTHWELQEAHRALDAQVVDRTTQLVESEARYKSLFENAEISIWNEDLSTLYTELETLRLSGVSSLKQYLEENPERKWEWTELVNVKHVNRATLALFEAPSEEEMLNEVGKIFGPGSKEVFIEILCAIWEGEAYYRGLANFITFSGRELTAIVSLNIPKRSEEFQNIAFSIIDITDRVAATRELEESEARLNEAQRIAHIGSWELDINTGHITCSREVFAIFEISSSSRPISYDDYLAYVHIDDREFVKSRFQDAVECKTSFNIEHRLVVDSGTMKHVNVRCETSYDDLGRALQSVGTIHDISDRVQAEEAFRKSEKRFRSYIESAPLGVFVTDAQGAYIDVNHVACRMTGYSKEELLNMSIGELVFEEDMKRVLLAFRDVIEKGTSSTEVRYVRKDQTICYVLIDSVKLSDSELLAFSRDITEKRELESELRQTEKMRAIGQLAGGIAHDFNNQLTGILGYAELLHDELEKENCSSMPFLNDIIRGVHRAATLTSQLLAFSRKGSFHSRVVNVHELIDEVSHLLERTIDKRISIRKTLSAVPPNTQGDPTQLQNALLNLALNARDALPDGGEIEFHTLNSDISNAFCEKHSLDIKPGRYLLLTVADNGIGMDNKTRQRIFEPFFTTKELGKGTGMGLAAVYGTIKSHKGVILVDSTPGQGTIFSIYLPLVNHRAEEEPLIIPLSSKERKAASILLVDDDEVVRSVVYRMLERSGYTVALCSDGLEAVDYYREHYEEIDLIILDLVMPVMGGKKVFPLLREINPEVIVLVSSGYSLEGEAQSIIDVGASGFIQKPFKKDTLIQRIHELLEEE